MDIIFSPISSIIGATYMGLVKFILCLLISYPLGSLFIRIPSSQPGLKHIFNLTVTSVYFLLIMNMYSEFLQLLGSVIIAYIIVVNIQGPTMPWIVLAFTMGHLWVNFIICEIYHRDYQIVELTGLQMELTKKLCTFAWNVWDGQRPVQDLDKWQLEKRITKCPSLLEVLGFSFHFPELFFGPSIEYSSYMSFIDESIYKTTKTHEHTGLTKPGRKVPKGRKRVACRKMAIGLVCFGLFVGSRLRGYDYSEAFTPGFKMRSILYRVTYFQICGIMQRSYFYAIWTLAEGACISTGLGFTGYGPTGQSLWEGAANVNILLVEFAPNFKVLKDSWNMKTNVWLRECVYKRVTPKGKKPGFWSITTTVLMSSVWHGTHGGSYMTLLLAGFITVLSRLCRTSIRPIFLPAPGTSPSAFKCAYDITGTILTILCMNYITAPFFLNTIRDALRVWQAMDWYGLWLIFGGLACFYSGAEKAFKSFHPSQAAETNAMTGRQPAMEDQIPDGCRCD